MGKALIHSPDHVEGTTTEVLPPTLDTLAVGQWYWFQTDDDRVLCCVTRVGSSFAKLDGYKGDEKYRSSWRVHFDRFDKLCTPATDAEEHIASQIDHYRGRTKELMEEVRLLTARLGVAPTAALNAGDITVALATLSAAGDIKSYEKSLVRAKEKQLPALFEQIKHSNEMLANWMTLETLPLEVESERLKHTLDSINDRIFSVQLYAGLCEDVAQIRDGEPARIDEPIRLMQRRHYMDEECLLDYRHGGMEFKNIGAFDRWLARPKHRDRILPFPRCVVAFQVRRHNKERDIFTIEDFIRLVFEGNTDKMTFLYMRNGDQLFRMQTGIEFEEKLFPNLEHLRNDRVRIDRAPEHMAIISDDEYKALVEQWDRTPKDERWRFGYDDPRRCYRPFDPDNVYYDDALGSVRTAAKEHNRIALVLQGLLDRSPVFHPHPPWQLWTDEGFHVALDLIYDDSRALVAGPPPDFEAYRARLNESLGVGSITVGQQSAWLHHIVEQHNARHYDRHLKPSRYVAPSGNPGPGRVSRVVQFGTRSRKCTFRWMREARTWSRWGDNPDVRCAFTTEADKLLNVDAYTPGDFKQFYEDPRTRADYLKWAPLLLEAEEYHAGNRDVGSNAEP